MLEVDSYAILEYNKMYMSYGNVGDSLRMIIYTNNISGTLRISEVYSASEASVALSFKDLLMHLQSHS